MGLLIAEPIKERLLLIQRECCLQCLRSSGWRWRRLRFELFLSNVRSIILGGNISYVPSLSWVSFGILGILSFILTTLYTFLVKIIIALSQIMYACKNLKVEKICVTSVCMCAVCIDIDNSSSLKIPCSSLKLIMIVITVVAETNCVVYGSLPFQIFLVEWNVLSNMEKRWEMGICDFIRENAWDYEWFIFKDKIALCWRFKIEECMRCTLHEIPGLSTTHLC